MFNVYSLVDIKGNFHYDNHPDNIKDCPLDAFSADGSSGRIGFSYAGDTAQNTKTATGFVTVNRIRTVDGTIQLEVPWNSHLEIWIRHWINHITADSTPTKEFADAYLTIEDPFAEVNSERNNLNPSHKGRIFTFYGVVPQKKPDHMYEQTAGNITYNLLFAEMEES